MADGGLMSNVIIDDGVVRRDAGAWTSCTHRVLRDLEASGYPWSPRIIEPSPIDGREQLSYIDGYTADGKGDELLTLDAIGLIAGRVKQFHTALRSDRWRHLDWVHERSTSETSDDTVCHNDLNERNIVFRDGEPVGFIDWDFCRYEDPMWDVAALLWQLAPLVDPSNRERRGFKSSPDLVARIIRITSGYGLRADQGPRLLAAVPHRIQTTLGGLQVFVDSGVPFAKELARLGVLDELAADLSFVLRSQDLITEGIAGGCEPL